MSRLAKAAIILYFSGLSLTFLLLRNSPATGFENSIYRSTPLFVWLFLAGSTMAGIAIIVYYAFRRPTGWGWLLGLIMVLGSKALIVTLPLFRQYYFYQHGDPIAHLGFALDIFNSGHLSQALENYYPLVHLLVSQMALVTDVPVVKMAMVYPALITVLNVFFVYLFATATFRERAQVLLVTAAASPLLFGLFNLAIYTHNLAYLSFPLAFYLYFKSRSTPVLGYRVALVILLLAFPFTHPFAALTLMVFLAVMELSRVVFRLAWSNPGSTAAVAVAPRRGASFNTLLVSFVTFVVWMSPFVVFSNQVLQLSEILKGHVPLWNEPHIIRGMRAFFLEGFDYVQWAMRAYGHIILYALLSLVALIIVLLKSRRKESLHRNLLLLLIWVIVGEMFMITFFFIARTVWITRIVMSDNMLALSPVFVGFLFYYVFSRKKRLGLAVSAGIISLAAVLSMLNIYRSPFIFQTNMQVTRGEVQGTDWFVNDKARPLYFITVGWPQSTPMFSLGMEKQARQDINDSDVRMETNLFLVMPERFGYPVYDTLGEQVADPEYLLIGRDRLLAILDDPGLRQRRVVTAPSVERFDFSEADFRLLEQDATVNKVFSNGALDIYLVRPPK